MRASTAIYLFLVSGAIIAAGPVALGASMTAGMVIGYGIVVLLLASVALYRYMKRPPPETHERQPS